MTDLRAALEEAALQPLQMDDESEASSEESLGASLEEAPLPAPPAPDGSSKRSSRWVDAFSCRGICQLILDDRKSSHEWEPSSSSSSSSGRPKRRLALPPALYADCIAPFLRFEGPLPNMLYAFGGRNTSDGPLATVEMFDTYHGRWLNCPSMPTRRAGSAAAILPDNRIMVIGGYNQLGIAEGLLATCDVYNPYLQKWEEDSAAPLRRKRWGHGCASLRGKIYVVGGCSLQAEAQPQEAFMETLKCCEVYDPLADRWSPCASLEVPRSGSRVVALDDRYLAAIGGCDDVFGRAETQPTVEIFDAESERWSLLDARLQSPRTTAAVAAIGCRRVLIVGGAPSMASAEVYNVGILSPEEDSCSSLTQTAAAANARGGSATSSCGEAALEDEDGDARPLAIADMPEGRMGCQAAVLNLPRPGAKYPVADYPCVVVVGGERCEDNAAGDWPRVRQFPTIPVYDIATGAWREDSEFVMPQMASARTAVALCVGVGHVNVDSWSQVSIQAL
eukprot:TRINITY_DN90862_c0_g1_i1.p1 TRINITY_DN90862_c0_g1~~TRINITY_DN90862_c0_g1_i1.p1  ORF type:complete len:554 (+),score=104.19 TRINITY_DN90862_c0_g1_i1:145-1662(+)